MTYVIIIIIAILNSNTHTHTSIYYRECNQSIWCNCFMFKGKETCSVATFTLLKSCQNRNVTSDRAPAVIFQCIQLNELENVLELYPELAEKFSDEITKDLTYNLSVGFQEIASSPEDEMEVNDCDTETDQLVEMSSSGDIWRMISTNVQGFNCSKLTNGHGIESCFV